MGSATQALLLGHAQAVARGTSADELRAWRMAPFIDAVLRQPRSRPLLRASARLLRWTTPPFVVFLKLGFLLFSSPFKGNISEDANFNLSPGESSCAPNWCFAPV